MDIENFFKERIALARLKIIEAEENTAAAIVERRAEAFEELSKLNPEFERIERETGTFCSAVLKNEKEWELYRRIVGD